jgi:hypothetical protein
MMERTVKASSGGFFAADDSNSSEVTDEEEYQPSDASSERAEDVDDVSS